VIQIHLVQLLPLGLRDGTWSTWSMHDQESTLLDRLRRALARLVWRTRSA
jgi:hypothetical protein